MEVVVYSLSGNTRRFADRLGLTTVRLVDGLVATAPYVLLTPTYGGRLPAPVDRFLDHPGNRDWLRGVVSGGNRNFGADYGAAGRAVHARTGAPHLASFELTGLPEDVERIGAQLRAALAPGGVPSSRPAELSPSDNRIPQIRRSGRLASGSSSPHRPILSTTPLVHHPRNHG